MTRPDVVPRMAQRPTVVWLTPAPHLFVFRPEVAKPPPGFGPLLTFDLTPCQGEGRIEQAPILRGH